MVRKKVIIDASPGLDDARALMLMLAIPDVEVIAITTVAGNSYVDQVTKNVKSTLNAVHRTDIPVFKGTSHNLNGEQITGNKYFGENAFGNLNIPIEDHIKCLKILAPQAIVNLVNKYPKEVMIVAFGPLTNIALAYLLDRSLPSKITGLFWVGGDRSQKTTYNITENAHINAFYDPHAVKLILENFGQSAICPLFLIDWTFCQKYPVEPITFRHITDLFVKKHKRELESQIFKATPPEIKSEFINSPVPKLYITSEFVALVAYDVSLITKSETVKLTKIELEGLEKGHTTFTQEKDSNIILVDDIDFGKFKTLYFEFIEKTVRKPVGSHKHKDCLELFR